MIIIKYTENLRLGKPIGEEKYEEQVQNTNMDILDAEMTSLKNKIGNIPSTESIEQHMENENNPHKVTKEQVGLSEVQNTRQMNYVAGTVTNGGVPVFNGNGYSLRDSGFTIGKSVPSDAKFTDTVYDTGTSSASGLTKLYSEIGNNTDGTMTQNAVTYELDNKIKKSQVVSNLLATISGNVLDATQGKILSDKIDVIIDNLTWKMVFTGEAENNVKYPVEINFTGYSQIALIMSVGQDYRTAIGFSEGNYGLYVDYSFALSDGHIKIRIHEGGDSFTVLENSSSLSLRRIYVRR